MRFGYTLLGEQAAPREIVRSAAGGERAGFDFEVFSDHYSPWLDEQGHSPYTWSVLGAVAEATERAELMTFVTCPTMRYHPAVVAQKAATVQLLTGDRFTLGLGAGENLNEHVIGRNWPPANVRHVMLSEAVEIISALFDGGYVNYTGEYFDVDSAKIWDLPDQRVPVGIAVSGPQSVENFAPLGDAMIAVSPSGELCRQWDATREDHELPRSRKIGQLPVSWDPDRDAAVRRAREQFRWFAGGWKVNAELPGTPAFAAATQYVREEDVAAAFPCGPELDPILQAVDQFREAGFTDLAFVQIGGSHQDQFLEFADSTLLPELRKLHSDS